MFGFPRHDHCLLRAVDVVEIPLFKFHHVSCELEKNMDTRKKMGKKKDGGKRRRMREGKKDKGRAEGEKDGGGERETRSKQRTGGQQYQ